MTDIKKPTKEMIDYAKDQMIRLLQNMALKPVDVYSVKNRGQEKQYFIGTKWMEELIQQVRKS